MLLLRVLLLRMLLLRMLLLGVLLLGVLLLLLRLQFALLLLLQELGHTPSARQRVLLLLLRAPTWGKECLLDMEEASEECAAKGTAEQQRKTLSPAAAVVASL